MPMKPNGKKLTDEQLAALITRAWVKGEWSVYYALLELQALRLIMSEKEKDHG